MKIAALLTTFNRRDKTLASLTRLSQQRPANKHQIDVVLVDAASSDGTADAVAAEFPMTTVIHEDSSLFWNGGMARAFEVAMQPDYDAYLLLNDDTEIMPDTIDRMATELLTYAGLRAIIVGTVVDPVTGLVTYGGWSLSGGMIGARLVRSHTKATACDTFNANCVLVGRGAAAELGNLDRNYVHGLGDLDYGLRAKRLGIPQILLPGAVGTCEPNDGRGLWTDTSLSRRERWRRLVGPKGLPPRAWLHYCKSHAGILWPLLWAKPYIDFWLKPIWQHLRNPVR